ncbi:uncharacterized protein TNCV_3760251 [Trichonephila clavipes]|nr:uncharacterized protein TNCV_3760251 [Trichonephila clavipes]
MGVGMNEEPDIALILKVHSRCAYSIPSTRGESSSTSFDSTAIVTDTKFTSDEPKKRVTFVEDPQSSTSTNELSDPPAYEDVVYAPSSK